MPKIKIGVLSLQGAVSEHLKMIENAGGVAKRVLTPADLREISGIILPGGESTAIGKLLKKSGLFEVLREKIKSGFPVFGTCAGAILLAKSGSDFSMKVADFGVRRNGFGRQIASFSAEISIKNLAENFPAIFIRAPRFENIGKRVEILAKYKNEPIFLREKNIWAASFHPELSKNPQIHRAFLEFCGEK